MQEIKEKKNNYEIPPQDAIITKRTIIPGIIGQEIDIDKSYQKMKKLGVFNENLLVFKEIKPTISHINQYDKIIIPNKKNKVSLIFHINNQNILENIDNILKTYNVQGNILNNTYQITNTNFQNTISTNPLINNQYCLTFDLSISEKCIMQKKYTILSKSNIINTYYLTNTKSLISENNILIYSFQDNNLSDLSLIIKYLKNNHYEIITIDELISENG